ncbi:MAG: 4-hydroxy-3-methylbut-2-enyl diphosphate reductase [Spirochaetes bacterium]|nr:MAG: 4-hydroxy-3-methylbut-2-enyl diphosphate reductase [Spirochaetota bacterium]
MTMTRVFYDKNAGLCAGVKRTIRGAVKAVDEKTNVTTFGELVHNPIVTQNLKNLGINFIHRKEELKNGQYVVVRAHGIPPQDEIYLKEKNIEYIDLTCPRVKIIHNKIDHYRELGYKIIIVGYAGHAEAKGHLGHAGKNGIVVSSTGEVKNLRLGDRALIIAQTTISEKLFNDVIKALGNKIKNAEVANSICPFVINRLKWIQKYSKMAEASVIIGGYNSSNTKQLYEEAKKYSRAFWIAYPEELEIALLKSFKTVALTAGASTPDFTIQKVVNIFRKNNFSVTAVK